MSSHTPTPVRALLQGYSLEITGADSESLRQCAHLVPEGTCVNVTFLAGEDLDTRVAAARTVRELGLTPVPHVAARRLGNADEARAFLRALHEVEATERLFVVGGDPAKPLGPYDGAIDLMNSGLLEEFGVEKVGLGGYPEGHPAIPDSELWDSLQRKTAALTERGISAEIITQFGFDDDPILAWIRRVRQAGISAPVRIGLPGPAGIKRLLGFARRFGVASSAGIAKKYGLSLTNLLGTAGPGRLAAALAQRLDPVLDGSVGVHLYTFGSVPAAAQWAHDALTD